jgi:hypothetical protein
MVGGGWLVHPPTILRQVRPVARVMSVMHNSPLLARAAAHSPVTFKRHLDGGCILYFLGMK